MMLCYGFCCSGPAIGPIPCGTSLELVADRLQPETFGESLRVAFTTLGFSLLHLSNPLTKCRSRQDTRVVMSRLVHGRLDRNFRHMRHQTIDSFRHVSTERVSSRRILKLASSSSSRRMLLHVPRISGHDGLPSCVRGCVLPLFVCAWRMDTPFHLNRNLRRNTLRSVYFVILFSSTV